MQNLVLIGTGLIGGSLAAAARTHQAARRIWAINRKQHTSDQARQQGIADESHTHADLPTLTPKLNPGDTVVIAVPVGSYPPILQQLGNLPPGVWLTDVGSTKSSVIEAVRQHWPGDLAQFVPGHPIAGSEKSGLAAADSTLFASHRTILTPLPETNPQALDQVAALWRKVGAEVDTMPPAQHDQILAATSHLPHLLAYALVDTLAAPDQSSAIFRYAAGGFRDFTRIAASDPTMWRDIFTANRPALLAQLDHFTAHLTQLRHLIESADSTQLQTTLERAQAARQQQIDPPTPHPPPP